MGRSTDARMPVSSISRVRFGTVCVARIPRGPRLRNVRSYVSSLTISGDMLRFT